MKRKKLQFKEANRSLTEEEMAVRRPQILKWVRLIREARGKAKELFNAYENLLVPDFLEYVEAHPPTPETIRSLIAIAVATENPDKPSLLGKKKSEKLYGGAKKMILAAWAVYRNSPSYKSKRHFATLQAKTLTDANGKPIAESTIYHWLPKKK